MQVLDISTKRVKGQQVIGVIISGIDTTGCASGVITTSSSTGATSGYSAVCTTIEKQITGTFKLSFDPNACGTDPAVSDSNWCARSLDLLGITGYACSGSSACVTSSLSVTTCTSSSSCSTDAVNAALIQTALAGLYGSDPTQYYMQDGTGSSVTVSVNQRGPLTSSTTGAYVISYTVVFDSLTLRGQLAPLTVASSSLAYTGGTFNAHYPAIAPYSAIVGNGGDLSTAGATAYQSVLGSQPAGFAELVYTCESTTWTPTSVTVYYPGNVVYVNQASGTTALAQYMYIRLQTTYHQVIAKAASDGSGLTKWQIYPSFKKTGQLTTSGSSYTFSGGSDMQTTADYGYYYSDPTASNGVSTSCGSSNQYTTLELYPTAAALSVVNLLRGLTTVINQDSDSISVTRTPYGVNSGRVGYLWTITFAKQHGDVPLLGCTTKDGLNALTLTSTVTANTTRCSVTTAQHGSLITGNFSLGQTFPHAYQGTPKANSTSAIPWNINALNLSYVLSNTLASDGTNLLFGTVTVARVAYIPPGQKRWSGGYLWTLAFVSRNGMLPATTHSKDTLNMMNGNLTEVWLETATQSIPFTFDSPNVGAQGLPGVAVSGNQVTGHYGITFTDQLGVTYTSPNDAFSIVSPTTGQALSALEFQTRMNMLFNNQTRTVVVKRSSTFNSVMCYFYSIEFTGKNVGGAYAVARRQRGGQNIGNSERKRAWPPDIPADILENEPEAEGQQQAVDVISRIDVLDHQLLDHVAEHRG